ncbi:hypothetical protein [Methanomassiliicoccus luminyensis]|uniref:hypothetical protein n=1 Tax=Methanomassiliicoccus luminyensis TaxID=1080712 RepID=UPI00037BEC00|nr:hypothetical protein [Methanomassiliicoccus luminyensis]
MEIEGISFRVGMNSSELKRGAEEAKGAVEDLSNETQEMASNMAQAGDQASDSMRGLSDEMNETARSGEDLGRALSDTERAQISLSNAVIEAEQAAQRAAEAQQTYNDAVAEYGANSPQAVAAAQNMTKANNDAALANDKVAQSHEKVEAASKKNTAAMKDSALGMTQALTSGFALYQAFDSIEKKQYQVEMATLAADRATKSVGVAQTSYNAALAKYGADAPETVAAYTNLEIANQAAELATQKVQMAQNDLNDQMTRTALTVVPAVISGIDGLSRAWKGMQGLGIGEHLETLKGKISGLGSDKAGPLFSAAMGAASLGFAFGAFTTDSEETRIAFSLLTGATLAAASAQWIWNAAKSFGLGLTGFGLALVGAAGVAAAGVYALSEMYGAPANKEQGDELRKNAENNWQQGQELNLQGLSDGSGGGSSAGGAGGSGGPVKTRHVMIRWSRDGTDANGNPTRFWYVGDSDVELDDNTVAKYRNTKPTYKSDASWKYLWETAHSGSADGEWTEDQRWEDYGGSLVAYYGSGGLVTEPTFAVIGDTGPERVLNPAETRAYDSGRGGGNTYIFNVDGARDVDLVTEAIASKLQRERGMMG